MIAWPTMSADGHVDKRVGIVLVHKSHWKDYCMFTVLEDDGKVRDVYVRDWEVISSSHESR